MFNIWIIFIFCFLTFGNFIANAGQRHWYDPVSGKRLDVRTEDNLSKNFYINSIGLSDQSYYIDLEPWESTRVINGELVSYNYVEENKNVLNQLKLEKDQKRKNSKQTLELLLGKQITDLQFNVILEGLK